MPTGIRVCKVCGKEYPYCKTQRKSNIFRYQDVACCPEHGSIYLSRINESRGIKETTDLKTDSAPSINVVFMTDYDDYEELEEVEEEEEEEIED